jgi:hypothetical protein
LFLEDLDTSPRRIMSARNCHDEVTMDDRFQTRASNIQSVLCVWSVVIYTATHPAGASSEARGPIARPALMQIDPCLKPGVTKRLYLSGQEVLVGGNNPFFSFSLVNAGELFGDRTGTAFDQSSSLLPFC